MKKLLVAVVFVVAGVFGLAAPASAAGQICIDVNVNGTALPINGCTALP